MQPAAPATDGRSPASTRVRANRDAQPVNERRQSPHRFRTPRRPVSPAFVALTSPVARQLTCTPGAAQGRLGASPRSPILLRVALPHSPRAARPLRRTTSSLSRLQRLGLTANGGDGPQADGEPPVWRLTDPGVHLTQSFRAHAENIDREGAS
jgi:hypothetical protein